MNCSVQYMYDIESVLLIHVWKMVLTNSKLIHMYAHPPTHYKYKLFLAMGNNL